ncbi:lyase family protein [Winogradskya humida]|uniref:Adenylosuccinate lyase C-terminal domain-containing protein n=1 Tax=Winogradskya humida TaxID=113566 RepID=A0ABQ4A7D4_9ACTN|nr:lyase family protein [Actinoplanes humidus]GIE26736.1 hypothetical protein Ahu01nite_098380 [Actinoplanes humidus]
MKQSSSLSDTGVRLPGWGPPGGDRPWAGRLSDRGLPEAALPSRGLFDGVLAAGPVWLEVSDPAWIHALLDAEAALALATAGAGLASYSDARAVARACAGLRVDIASLSAEAAATGTPVVPLVARLRAALTGDAAALVHRGATSQDIVDTAAMLVAHRAIEALLIDLDGAASLAASLADQHRDTLVAGRTLLQQALPTTFGLVAAGWLSGLDAARRRLAEVQQTRLAVQLGGAVGTLAGFTPAPDFAPAPDSAPDSDSRTRAGSDDGSGTSGGPGSSDDSGSPGGPGSEGGRDGAAYEPVRALAVVAGFSELLGLVEPELPWHTERTRIAELAGALGAAAGAIGKVARDITLYAQTEVGELTEGGAGGGSSTLPHKRNPIHAVSAAAAAATTPALVAMLLSAMPQEHQRAAGSWHAEWQPLRALLVAAGSAAYSIKESLSGLEVHADRMRANLDLTHGALLAERVAGALRPMLGAKAHDVVREAVLRGDLATDPAITAHLSPARLAGLLDPGGYIGSSSALINRVLTSRNPTTPAPANPAPANPAPADRAPADRAPADRAPGR